MNDSEIISLVFYELIPVPNIYSSLLSMELNNKLVITISVENLRNIWNHYISFWMRTRTMVVGKWA